jgi:hypothetical protein
MNYYTDISNKDNLLITIGDSWTEGVGNYIPEDLIKFNENQMTGKELYSLSAQSRFFYKGAWPLYLSKLLDCDLINLGQGGDANSASAKRLISDIDLNTKFSVSKYKKVTVFWLLSDPARFSFYTDQYLKSYNINDTIDFVKLYVQDVYKQDKDGLLETKFFIKAMENYCQVNNYNFVYGSAFTNIGELNKIYNSPSNIHNYVSKQCAAGYLSRNDQSVWAHCGHPNAKGYELIAKEFYNILKTHFKEKI